MWYANSEIQASLRERLYLSLILLRKSRSGYKCWTLNTKKKDGRSSIKLFASKWSGPVNTDGLSQPWWNRSYWFGFTRALDFSFWRIQTDCILQPIMWVYKTLITGYICVSSSSQLERTQSSQVTSSQEPYINSKSGSFKTRVTLAIINKKIQWTSFYVIDLYCII